MNHVGTGLFETFIVLLMHLDGEQVDAGAFGRLGLGAAVSGPYALEVGFREVSFHELIRSFHKFCGISFVEGIVHLLWSAQNCGIS